MPMSVCEAHKEVVHYTSAAGLHGIITGGCLWATQIGFLNDASEHLLFLKHRVSRLLESTVRDAFSDLMKREKFAEVVRNSGGFDAAVQIQLDALADSLFQVSHRFDDPYVLSFCTTKKDEPEVARDGLLSQWRGYGVDGGYAIVFRTDGLDNLLVNEASLYNYQAVNWGDVQYYDDVTQRNSDHEEVRDYEEVVKKCAYEFMTRENQDAWESAYLPISYLSCIYKHWGFHEERELRVIMIRTHEAVLKEADALGEKGPPPKEVFHRQRDGLLIPTIRLFERVGGSSTEHLPISKVIVGPHPDKWQRKKSVELLLAQYGIRADVDVSGIPYLGR